jgi:predicted oxidoreductase (fatty acid repression mutant protein)
VAVSLAAFSLRSRPTLLELRATWYGREVVLYTATDERVFNQVSRALRRAIEDESWDDVEAA